MTVFELVAKIALDDTDYSAAVDRAKTKAESAKESLSKIGTAAKDAGKTFAKIGTGIAAAGTAVFAFANKVTQTGDNIDKMSQKLGISAEAYQEWDFILTHCGTSVEGLQTSMKTLANAAADGTDSTKAAFEKLGLSMDEVASMSQEDLFSAVITGLQNMGESTERTAVAADLLGRSATELGPVFNMSAEETEALRQQVHDLGAVMSDDAVKNSAAFQDALTDVKTAFSGAANTLAEELIPHITDLMNNIAAFVADGGVQKIIDGFEALAPAVAAATAAFVAYKAATAIAGVIDALRKSTDGMTVAQAALNAIMNANPFVLIATLIAGVVAALVTLWHTNEDFRNAVQKIWEDIKGFFLNALRAIENAWSSVKQFFSDILSGIKNTFSNIGSWFGEKFRSAKEAASNAWSDAKSKFSNHWQNIKGAFGDVKGWFSEKFTSAKDKAVQAWESAKEKFHNVVEKLKSFLKFDWSLPKIKLPHFSITGSFSLSPPSIPHISVSWYKKAMDNAMLLNDPTIFGMSGNTFLGAGEAGPEVVSGADTLMKMITKAVKGSMGAPVININVNGANIQDDQKLAEKIAFQFQMLIDEEARAVGAV